MSRAASLCDVPLSTAFDSTLPSSLLSLDWVLASGLRPNNSLLSGRLCLPYYRDSTDGVWSLNVQLAISASLPFDLVLGHDWLQLSQTTLPYASFDLASGLLNVQATTQQRTYFLPLFPCLSQGHRLPCDGRESSNGCFPSGYVLNMLCLIWCVPEVNCRSRADSWGVHLPGDAPDSLPRSSCLREYPPRYLPRSSCHPLPHICIQFAFTHN
jgi:hypothetical protein